MDSLYREIYGEQPRGKHLSSSPNEDEDSDDQWSYRKTSELLNESEGKTIQDIQLAKGIKEYPEIMGAPNKTVALRQLKRKRETEEREETIKGIELKNLIHGDAVTELTKLGDSSIDLVLTDPKGGRPEKNSSPNDELWSYRKTSELLNESEGKTRQDIQKPQKELLCCLLTFFLGVVFLGFSL